MKTYTDFYYNGQSHEAIELSWEEVGEILDHKFKGTPEDDKVLIQYLVEHTVFSYNWFGECTIDEDGWVILIKP
jgi:hypothetical protein